MNFFAKINIYVYVQATVLYMTTLQVTILLKNLILSLNSKYFLHWLLSELVAIVFYVCGMFLYIIY